MAPKSPWKNKTTTTNNATLQSTQLPAIDYGEAQRDEVEALRAIYMEDFEDVETKTAWSKVADRSFKLKLRSFSESESFVILSVQLTATYPRTLPLLDVQGLQVYHERTQKRIENIIHEKAKQLVGDVMIHAMASDIQDALEDAVQARQQGALPSLEDERATAEEVAASMAREAEQAEARRRQEAQDEEDRVLKLMVDEEIGRREKVRPSRPEDVSALDSDPSHMNAVHFDQPALMVINNEIVQFSSLLLVSVTNKTRDEEEFLAKPQVPNGTTCPLVVVKKQTFEKTRDAVMELEALLETVCSLRHANIVSLLAFRIEKQDLSRSRLILCYDNMTRGTLEDLLDLGSLHVDKGRQFTIQLLEALEYLHQKGIGHGNICVTTVMLTGSPVVPKLAEIGFTSIASDANVLPRKWQAPEGEAVSQLSRRRADIWQMGVLVVQMVLGQGIVTEYGSPQTMLSRLSLSDSFADFLHKILMTDVKKRPSAFDLLPSEFLRTDHPVLQATDVLPQRNRATSGGNFLSLLKHRSRHNSSSVMEPASRYAMDFTELGRLGKGGFGEVVKARNKLDGGIYAIKKIKQAPQLLDQVISEVMLLNRLNHPYVVRYFSTWVEEDAFTSAIDGSSTATETATQTATETDRLTEKDVATDDESSDGPRMDFGYQSTGGLDFVSSSGFPQIEFGDDSDNDGSDIFGHDEEGAGAEDEEAVESADEMSSAGPKLRKIRSDSRRAPSMLYIQMEYCERHTLRDLVRKAMSSDDAWRYVREITEGLAHIHGHGIIHRDLKPDNIFIDVAGNPKIGDFGLATTSQYHPADKAATMSGRTGGDLTRSVGTTLYVAPELRSSSNTSYTDKVDMYSLGIIFYEMCRHFSTGMERVKAIQGLREKQHELPPDFQVGREKAAQGKLITCLVSHKPSERLSSKELLRSDILPVKIEDETIRQALSGLSDPRSPYHQKMMSALFAHDSAGANRVKALAWDARTPAPTDDGARLRLRGIARRTLEAIFKRHGAEDARREAVFPRSSFNTNNNVVQLLDSTGNLLQLPYDLTVPYARQLAQHPAEVRCTYSFGSAYRDTFTGGPPRANEEVDFDIVDYGSASDRLFNEAEVLKVIDEVVCEMPLFATLTTISLHLSHTSMLGAILDHCRVPAAQQAAVKEILSRLGFNQCNWAKTRAELRRFGLSDTTLDDMQQFDFRDTADNTVARMTSLFASANARTRAKLDSALRSLADVVTRATQFGLQRKVYIVPLASVKATFYESGILFQCVLERKSTRLVVAAGGRYDSLIKAQRTSDTHAAPQGAVGVAISLDFIISHMARNSENASTKAFLKDSVTVEATAKRCDVLVVAGATDAMYDAGIRMLVSLWQNDISAELAMDIPMAKEHDHSFVVTLRHEASNSVRVTSPADGADGSDVPVSTLVSYLQQELREREGSKLRQSALPRQASQNDNDRKGNVQVLMARHGSKKSNKYQIISDAQVQWERKLDDAKSATILAVETRDDILELIQQTRLSDAESWRKTVHSVQLNDRLYVQQIHEVLQLWRKNWAEADGMREACVFNFRTQFCIYYDLGL